MKNSKVNRSYSALILLVFIRNFGKSCKSKKHLMIVTDKLAEQLGIPVDITDMTKHNIINEMVANNILIKGKWKESKIPIKLSYKTEKFLIESLNRIVLPEVEDEEDEE